MNTTKIVLSLFFLLPFLTSCGGTCCKSGCESYDLAYRNINAYSAQVRNTDGLQHIASGGRLLDQVRSISLHYVVDRKMDIDSARRLFVKTAIMFLDRMNQDEEIRPYLANYPFTEENLELKISTWRDEFVDGESINYITLIEGNVYYVSDNPDNGKSVEVYQEPYQEALAIFLEDKDKGIGPTPQCIRPITDFSFESPVIQNALKRQGWDLQKQYGSISLKN